jgi:carbon storage regulator CsrA
MLVMTRGVDEAIVVGEMIIRVVDVQDDSVRLGIASPHTRPRYREVTLRRDEGSDSLELALPEALAAN